MSDVALAACVVAVIAWLAARQYVVDAVSRRAAVAWRASVQHHAWLAGDDHSATYGLYPPAHL